jgi:hypothetical protein
MMPIAAIEKPAIASEGLRPGTWLIAKPPGAEWFNSRMRA